MRIKALSIKQPWAYLIAHGIKDIENRSWSTRYRGPLAIHAGKSPITPKDDREGVYDWLHEMGLEIPRELPMGGVVGLAMLEDIVTDCDSIWFEGDYGWILSHARPTPLLVRLGKLGLFEIDAPNGWIRFGPSYFGDTKEARINSPGAMVRRRCERTREKRSHWDL